MGSWSTLPLAGLEDFPVQNCNRFLEDFQVQSYHRFPENFRASPFPMLLVPFGRNDSKKRPYLYNIIDRRAYNWFSESIFNDKWIPGSTRGWLVTVDTLDKSINLLNPLTTRQISLPALPTFDKPALEIYSLEVEDAWYVLKAVIIFDASGKPENSVIVAIVSSQRRLCFCRVGDNKWKTVNHSPFGICDIIDIRGILWAVDQNCTLFAIVIGRRHTKLTMIVGRSPIVMPSQTYLVESCGGLLMVCRGTSSIEEDHRSQTEEVRVFTMVKSVSKYLSTYMVENHSIRRKLEVQYEWVEVESVGKQMVFLGYNHSLSLDPRAYPGCRGNRVYFADHLFDPDLSRFFFGGSNWHDIGVYHLQNKRIEFLKGFGELSASHTL